MPKFVVLQKNSIMLALLVSLLFSNSVKSDTPKTPTPLEQGIQCLALSKVCNNSGGFTKDTLVKIPTGYTNISDLKVGTMVSTFNEATESFCEKPVIAVSTTLATKTLWLTLDNEERTTICAGTQQSFYSYSPCTESSNLHKYTWLKSAELQNASLFTSSGICSIQDICKSSKLTKLYLIEVAETHNLFVTKTDILVHNNPFAIPAITKIATETAMLIAAGAKMVVDAVTSRNKPVSETTSETESQTPKKPTDKETTAPINPKGGTTSLGGSPGDPNKPPKKDNKETKAKCEGKCENKACVDTKKALRGQSKEASKRADQATEQARINREEKLKAEEQAKKLEAKISNSDTGKSKKGLTIKEYIKIGFCTAAMACGLGKFNDGTSNLYDSITGKKINEQKIAELSDKLAAAEKRDLERQKEATRTTCKTAAGGGDAVVATKGTRSKIAC